MSEYHMILNVRKWPLCNWRTTQAKISLRICTSWSGPLLSAYRINGYCNICRRTENVQIRLYGCVPLLFAHDIRALFPRCSPYMSEQLSSWKVRLRKVHRAFMFPYYKGLFLLLWLKAGVSGGVANWRCYKLEVLQIALCSWTDSIKPSLLFSYSLMFSLLLKIHFCSKVFNK